MSYKIVEKDPTVSLHGTRWLRPDREADINRQIDEVVSAMAESLVFAAAAETLGNQIDKELDVIITKMHAEIKAETPVEKAERLERLDGDRKYQESKRRTPGELAEEKWGGLKAEAIGILDKAHQERMRGRVKQFHTTCRLDGCEKQPRTANEPTNGGHKAARRSFVFCPGHAGMRYEISKADYRQLKSNKNLRVVNA